MFLSLEEETGMASVVIRPDLFARRREVVTGHSLLVVEGHLERRQGALNVRAERIAPLPSRFRSPSHDFQ